LPSDGATDAAENREADSASVSVMLPRAETLRLIERSGVRARSRMDEMLLSALLAAMQEWTGRPTVRVNLESHGRDALGETIDVSRTVGWFTALYPVTLETAADATPSERLADVKERVRAATARGPAYGWLRHAPGGDVLAAPAEISFNYLGRLDLALEAAGPFAPAAEAIGPDHSPDSPRAHALDFTAAVGNVAESLAKTALPRSQRLAISAGDPRRTSSSREMSAPAKKLPGQPERMMTPRGAGPLANSSSTRDSSSTAREVSTLWRWPGTRNTSTTKPSAVGSMASVSRSREIAGISGCSRWFRLPAT
jgi:hypothetical protein